MGSDIGKLRRSKSPVRIDIGVAWREVNENRSDGARPGKARRGAARQGEARQGLSLGGEHVQDTIANSCLEYEPTSYRGTAWQGGTTRDVAWHGLASQDKDSNANLKEVGEKTEDYFKRVNVFSRGGTRLDPARQDMVWQDPARQDKELKNEDL